MINKIKEVFTEQYKKDTEYLELKSAMKPYVKLKNASESIDVKISRLKECGYKSEFSINVGDF